MASRIGEGIDFEFCSLCDIAYGLNFENVIASLALFPTFPGES
jgi:hypothetical protein